MHPGQVHKAKLLQVRYVLQVIINGVIGWGVNSDSQIKHAIKAMHHVLRPSGLLVVGYNAGMVACCEQFTPLFVPTQLGDLAQTVDMADSEMHHVSYELWHVQLSNPISRQHLQNANFVERGLKLVVCRSTSSSGGMPVNPRGWSQPEALVIQNLVLRDGFEIVPCNKSGA